MTSLSYTKNQYTRLLQSAYLLVEPDDAEEDPEVDEHPNKDMCFHFLNSYDVIH